MRGVWRFLPFVAGTFFALFCLMQLKQSLRKDEPFYRRFDPVPHRKRENADVSTQFVDSRLAPLPILLKPREGFCDDKKFLVAMHISAHEFSRREMWRETYGKLAKQYSFNILFTLGTYSGNDTSVPRRIEKEAEKFGDILQSDFIDSYRNLTLKHISLLRFFDEKCGKDAVLLKLDDDMMWKVKEASNVIQKFHDNVNSTISCHWFRNWPVHRSSRDKWHVSIQEYAPKNWPTFCGGMIYIASHKAVSKLLETLHFSEFFWIDDAYLTGIVRSNSKFELNSINGIVNSQTNLWEKRLNGSHIFSLAPRQESRRVFEMFNKQ